MPSIPFYYGLRYLVWIFDQNVDVWLKFWFWIQFRFLTNISMLDQNFDFRPKIRCLTKISIFDQSFAKFRYLTKISVLHQNFDFWAKFRCSTKISARSIKFTRILNFVFLTKVRIFGIHIQIDDAESGLYYRPHKL